MNEQSDEVTMAAELTAAWLSNPHTRVSADEVASFLTSMHKTVAELGEPNAQNPENPSTNSFAPAISARKSLASPDHIVSMIDGKKYKTLRRHLATNGLTPDEYRQRFNLKADYPMVASAYSEARRAMAKTIGLGRKAATKGEKAVEGTVRSVTKGGQAALAAARKALGSDERPLEENSGG